MKFRSLLFCLLFPITSSLAAQEVEVLSQTGHRSAVLSLALLEKEGLVVTGGSDRTLVVWNAQTGEVLRRFMPRDAVYWLYHEPDTTLVWAWTMDRSDLNPAECFDVRAGTSVEGRKPPIAVTAGLADGVFELKKRIRDLQKASMDEGSKLWSACAKPGSAVVTGCATDSAAPYTLFGFDDGHAELWRTDRLTHLQDFTTRTAVTNAVACSGNGMRLASWQFYCGRVQTGSSDSPNLRFWDFPALRVRACEIPNTEGIVSACLTKDGRYLYAIVSRQSKTEFALVEVNADTGKFTRQIGPSLRRPASLRFSPDETLLQINEYFRESGSRILVWNRKENAKGFREMPW